VVPQISTVNKYNDRFMADTPRLGFSVRLRLHPSLA